MPEYGLWENPLSRIEESLLSTARRQEDNPPTHKADFHFLYLAPGVSVDYLFVAARKYWETFRTIVIHDLSLIQHVPRRYSIAITSLSRTDTASLVNEQIANLFGERVYHDPLVYDFPEDLQLTLDARAERNEPFGVPLQQ